MVDYDAEEQQQRPHGNPNSSESTPLLLSDARHIAKLRGSGTDWIAHHVLRVHGEDSWIWHLRGRLQDFFASKWGHYFVILLVSVDITCIFANFLISLHVCEHSGEKGFHKKAWLQADSVLDRVSLVISCLFMAELMGCVFAFGFSYFRSNFHIFDATVIVAGFLVDVVLRGQIEEAGSLIVVGRLWRVFKIIEEFSAGADDEISALHEKVQQLEIEREKVMKENEALQKRVQPVSNGNVSVASGSSS